MPAITEKEFDKLVNHTLRIELTDGTVLIYSVSSKQKGELIDIMRKVSFGDSDARHPRLLCFNAFPERTVIINIKYLLNLIFCFDSLAIVGTVTYRDNFEVLPDEEDLEEGDQVENFLPDVVVKMAYPLAIVGTQTLLFHDIRPGTLAGLDTEAWEPEDGIRQFIELEDEDGEPNFISLKHVMCLEAAHIIVDENLEEKP